MTRHDQAMHTAPSAGQLSAPGADDGTTLCALLARVGRADSAAFAELYDATSARVYGLARMVVRGQVDAERVTELAYVAVWTTAASYDRECEAVLSWMLALTHRGAVDHLRNTARAPRPGDPREAATKWPAAMPAADVHGPGSHRAALTLAYCRGYTRDQVALALDLPLEVVTAHMRDGLLHLTAGGAGRN